MGQESSHDASVSVNSEQQHKREVLSEKIARSIGVDLSEIDALSQFLLRNGYKLFEAELGRGESAVVFAASSVTHQFQTKPLAIKLVKCITPGKDQDIIKEFNILRQLRTPHVVEAVDLLQYTSPCNIILLSVIEQCKYTLHAFLRERNILNSLDILKICFQLSQGLSAIHNQDILHLDIKPSNIMLGFDGNWKFIDMEISMILPDNHLAVSSGITQMYCSPEQLKDSYLNYSMHSQGKITKSSDIYSLGLVFCELLGGLKDKRQVIQHKSKEGNRTAVLIDSSILSQFEQQLYEQLILPMIQLNPMHRIDINTVLRIVNQLQAQLQQEKQQAQQFLSSGSKCSPLITPKCNNSYDFQYQKSSRIQEFRFSLSDHSHSKIALDNSRRNSQNFEDSKHCAQQNQFSTDFLIKHNNPESSLGQFNTKYLFNQTINTN